MNTLINIFNFMKFVFLTHNYYIVDLFCMLDLRIYIITVWLFLKTLYEQYIDKINNYLLYNTIFIENEMIYIYDKIFIKIKHFLIKIKFWILFNNWKQEKRKRNSILHYILNKKKILNDYI